MIYVLRTPIRLAQKQLSIKYLHLGGWTAGILDYMLMAYRLSFEIKGLEFKEWLQTEYDPSELTEEFEKFRSKNYFFKVPR